MDNIRELDLGQPLQDEKTRAMYTMHAYRENEARFGRLRYLTRLSEKEAVAVKSLRALIAKACKYTGTDISGRALICTPCAGDHGAITFWVISVEGSPPRGTIFTSVAMYGEAFFIDGRKSRRLGSNQRIPVLRFVDVVLGGRGRPMIEGVPPVIVAEYLT